VNRALTAWLVVLLALPIASTAADAHRPFAVAGAPVVSDSPAPRAEEVGATPLATMSLASTEEGKPFAALPAVTVTNALGASSTVRLYDADGRLDGGALQALDDLLADARNPSDVHTVAIERRSLQLLFRAAYHFRASAVQIVSGYRQPRRRSEGYHGEGKAIDFKLRGVAAAALASYLRTLPRVGVGVYTNARTQFVHLDVRERSFYWLDASPPGRRWRERPIRAASMASRDAQYEPGEDLPEGTRPRQP
jgi:uncharacterized protein YcbK (DUF882 family)